LKVTLFGHSASVKPALRWSQKLENFSEIFLTAVGPRNSAEIERAVLWPVEMKENKWIRLLVYVTGLVNQELLLQNEYLAAENRILRALGRPAADRAIFRNMRFLGNQDTVYATPRAVTT
jgi:hypothetical protein